MPNQQTFEEFLSRFVRPVDLWPFLLDLALAGVLSWLLGRCYERYGRSLSNRRTLGRTFLMIGMTTTLVIGVVKSSLALSLGLVGALSIVRFRTAIKEPEELAYLFLTIALGLGFGAGQRLVTIVTFAVVVAVIMARGVLRQAEAPGSLLLSVSATGRERLDPQEMVALLRPHCRAIKLKRLDEGAEATEALFEVQFDDFAHLEAARGAVRGRGDTVQVSFVDGEGLGG